MKERLTGAIIVVAVLVLLVPELLTGPGNKQAVKPAGTEGAQLRSYTIDLQDDANRQPPPSAPAVAASDDPVAQATPEPEAVSPPVANVTPPVDEAARLAAAKAESSKPAPKPDATRVAAATPEPAKSAGTKGWAVQLGVFGSRENAERLAKQVKGSGFPVLVNETSGKDGKKLYWVRVGPAADPSAADALSTKLKAAGHRDARVVSYP